MILCLLIFKCTACKLTLSHFGSQFQYLSWADFDLSFADQVNNTVQNAWRALHFVMRVVKKGNKNTKSVVYKSLVRPILKYGAACWDPYRECQIKVLDRVQNKAAKFVHHTEGLDWESLAQRRKIARMCALFKSYKG
jgi:hypothetical protein